MKKTVIFFTALAVLAGVAFSLAGVYNSFIREENGIVAVHEDMKNVHASVYNNIKSQGLSVDKYGELVINAINAAISGRYGKTGSQAAFQFIQEQNPTIDPTLFEKLQSVIEAGYNKFESTQRSKIDRLRVYDNDLESFPRGTIASIVFGFPRKITPDMRATISSAETKKTFENKEMETIDPFKK